MGNCIVFEDGMHFDAALVGARVSDVPPHVGIEI